MNAQDKTTGGFAGDRTEASATATVSGCCGSAAPAEQVKVQVEAAAPVSPCCGTSEQAAAEGSCCATSAKAEAVASGAGCCG